jgi:DNA adenine methylase
MGSKSKIANQILPIILKDRKEGQFVCDLFCGGMNFIDKVEGNRIANDSHPYLMSMWIALSNDWQMPEIVTENMYNDIKNNKDNYFNGLVGFAGFMSFGGKWFAGYRRNVAGTKGNVDNMIKQTQQAKNVIGKQMTKLKDVQMFNMDYRDVPLPPNSILYLDPPYEGTTKYSSKFNHSDFWEWCRHKKAEGHTIFISEYNAPEDFICVKTIVHKTVLNKNQSSERIEKLFTL